LVATHGTGSYFVFSQKTGHKNFYEVTEDGTLIKLLRKVACRRQELASNSFLLSLFVNPNPSLTRKGNLSWKMVENSDYGTFLQISLY